MRSEQARKTIGVLYALHGIIVISWVPRFPEVKSQLSLRAGEFGLILSLGTLGSLLATLVMGHVIHALGSRRVLTAAFLSEILIVATLTHIAAPAVFAPLFVAFVASAASVALALNAQAAHIRNLMGGAQIMGRLHGLWAVGALTSGLIASAIADFVSLSWQMGVIAVVTAPCAWLLTRTILTPAEEKALAQHDDPPALTAVLRPNRLVALMSLAATGGALIEYASGDWAAIYTREEIGTSLGAAAFALTATLVGITAGRFFVDELAMRHGIPAVIRGGALTIVMGIVVLSPIATRIVDDSRTAALVAVYLGFTLVGLGTSGMMPLFLSGVTASAGAVSPSIVLAQMALLQAIMIWAHKAFMAFLADHFSIATALLWPALMAMVTFVLANLSAAKRPVQPEAAR